MKISDFCDFKYNFDFDPKIKHNVFCIVLFRLKNLYKKFDAYLYGLDEVIKYLSKYDKIVNDIKFRILYNKSIFDTKDTDELDKILAVMERANRCKHIQLIEYDCPAYKIDDTYDKGIFPVFLRYLYFFDFEDNDINYLYASDIDFTPYKIELNYLKFLIDTFNNLIVNNINFSFHTSRCYIPFWKKKLTKNDTINVLGGVIGGNIKLDHNIIMGFLKECENTTNSKNKMISYFYKNYSEYLNNKSIPYEYKKKKLKSYETDKIFVYGLDEFFLTYFVLPVIFNDSKIKNIYENVRNVASGGLHVLLQNTFSHVLTNKNINNETIELYNRILQNVLNKNIKKEDTVSVFNNFVNVFVKHDYSGDTDKPELYNKFYDNVIKIINSPNKKKLMLNDKYLDCFVLNETYFTDKNNFNKISSEKRITYYKLLTTE